MNQKHNTLTLFFVFWLFSVVLYQLLAIGSILDSLKTIFYIVVACASLVVLLVIKSDEEYYRNLTRLYFILALIVGLLMTAISWGLSLRLGSSTLNLSYALSIVAEPSSVITIFLSLMLYGLVMAATAEELMKLAGFAELKARFSEKHKYIGVFIYVGFPVGFWTLLHGIQAYDNLFPLVPAFVNGIILLVFLWKIKCIFAVILAHWVYNAGITILTFTNGQAPVPSGTPLFPDLTNIVTNPRALIADIAVVILVLVWIGFFTYQATHHKSV